MTKAVTIEGELFHCERETRDTIGRLKPGFYVRASGLGRLVAVSDPLWDHHVRAALPVGRSVRNLVIVSEPDGEPHVVESTTVDLVVVGSDWSADVILAPSGKREAPVKMTLPFGRKPPAAMAAERDPLND